MVLASRNDPYAAYDAVAALAADWGADLVDAGEAGGLNAASGHGPWPRVLGCGLKGDREGRGRAGVMDRSSHGELWFEAQAKKRDLRTQADPALRRYAQWTFPAHWREGAAQAEGDGFGNQDIRQ